MEENNVTANVGEVVTPQDTTTEVQTEVKPVESDGVTSTEVQGTDVTQTKAFASRLKEATEKARNEALDEFVANEGYTYNGQPVTTYAELQRIKAEIKAEEERATFQEQNGFNPEAVKPLFEQWLKENPRYQQLEQAEKEANARANLAKFNEEFPELGIKTVDDLNKLPNIDAITNYMQLGLSLNDAYFQANRNEILGKKAQSVQQETINKITANGQSSPGSLAGGGEPSFFTKEQVDAMSQAEVNKNYDLIIKSMKNW